MSEQTLLRLHHCLKTMDLPAQKKIASEPQDLRWLGRNMAIQNTGHPQFERAAATLKELGVAFVLGA